MYNPAYQIRCAVGKRKVIENCKSLFMVRSVGFKTICIVIAVHVLATSFVNFYFFKLSAVATIQNSTAGLINGTLLGSLLMAAVVLPIIFYLGNLKPKDLALTPALGLGEAGILRGLIWTALAVVIVHVAIVIAYLASGTAPTVNRAWFSSSAVSSIGNLLGQLFGNALYEEILFRAFLLPQLLLAFKKKYRKWSWNKCFWLSLLISQAVFALIHIPNRLYRGDYIDFVSVLSDQIPLFILGCILAALFLVSRNIYVAIGVHAITNFTPLLILNPIGGLQLTAYLVIFLIALFNRMSSKRSNKTK